MLASYIDQAMELAGDIGVGLLSRLLRQAGVREEWLGV